MKSLYESILTKTNSGIVSRVKDAITGDLSKEGAEKLDRLWKELGLDLSDFKWTYLKDRSANDEMYVYRRNDVFSRSTGIMFTASKHFPCDIEVAKVKSACGWTEKLSRIYKDHLEKKLGLVTKSENESYYYLIFKN